MVNLKKIRFLHEPMVQFLLLGGLLFAVDHYLISQQQDPRHIVIDDKQVNALIAIFAEGQGREPSQTELDKMILKWSQNEILYREAQQMSLEQGDDMIRNRLILKLRSVLLNRVVVEKPADEELQDFFEFNRARYDTPARYDFEQFMLTENSSPADAENLAVELADGAVPDEYRDQFRHYQARPLSNLSAMFGEHGAAALQQAAENNWVAVHTTRGMHLARLTRTYPAEPAQLDEVRTTVIRDWRKFSSDMQLADQTKAIADRYTIKMELSEAMEKRFEASADASENQLSALINE